MDFSTKNEDFPKIHVVFLHSTLRMRQGDRYLVDMAMAMKEAGHKVSIYTSEFEQENCFREVDELTGCLKVSYSGWWLPKKFKCLRSILMALRIIFFPPKPKPTLIVLDIKTVALYLISKLSSYKTIYLSHFAGLRQVEFCTKFMKMIPDRMSANSLKYADDVLVQSEGLADIFKRCFPNFNKGIKILHPCVDTGLWCQDTMDISGIVPGIREQNFLFVCFGSYMKISNFYLVIDAFQDLLQITAANIRNDLHLVIAAYCNESNPKQIKYYTELLESTKKKPFRSQVTLLKHVLTAHKKSLIEKSICVIIPCKHEVFPDMILPVLSAGRPIISTNTGFANEVLRHGISGILVELSPQKFAAAMYKVLTNSAIQVFLGDMGHDVFVKRFSNNVFRKKVNGIVSQYV